jgi:beta-lactamase regulating signal transducer with metallopeptidase domain/Leucine-rich repeat (LRR) protein
MLQNDSLNAEALIGLAWTQTWQVAVVSAVVAIVTALACRRRPHLAYFLWLLVLVKAMTPPVWSSPTGLFSWAMAERVVAPAAPLAPRPAPLPPTIRVAEVAPAEESPAVPNVTEPRAAEPVPAATRTIETVEVLLVAWTIGAVALGTWLGVNWLRLSRRIRSTTEQPVESIARQFANVKDRVGLRRSVRLLISRESLGPAALGWWRGTVIVPQSVVEQSTHTELDAIFAHELAHLRRFDPLVGTLQLAVQCLWWWHPAIWWANRQVRIERERSCDEAVLAQVDVRPADYARLLVELLERSRSPVPAVFWSGMRSTAATTARVRHVLETNTFRRRSPLAAWIVAALVLVVILPGAGSRFITAAPPEGTATNAEASPKAAKPAASEDGTESTKSEDEKLATPVARRESQDLINRLGKLGLRVTPVDMNGQQKLYADFDANFQPLAEPLPLGELPNLESIIIGDRRDLNQEQLISRLRAVRHLRPETNLLVFFQPDQGAAFDVLAEIPKLERLASISKLPPFGGTGRKITLAQLKNLRELSLLGDFTDGSLTELAPLDQLEVLQLYQEKPFAKLDLAFLENKPRLRRFITGGIEPTDEGFARIGKLPALEHLMTNFTSATDAGLSDLAKLSNLKTLTLDSSQQRSRVTPEGMLAIGKLTQLVKLTISGKFSGDSALDEGTIDDRLIFAWTSRLKQLKSLQLFNCWLTDEGLNRLSHLRSLVRLNLSGDLEITDDGMAHLGTITTLKNLSLANAAITDKGLSQLKPLTSLESLVLYNAPQAQVSDAELASLAGCSKLRKLVVTNAKIEGRGLAPFTTLTSLSLENNPVDDAGVETLVRNNQLTDLNLSGTKITDKAFSVIAANLPQLERLNVRKTQLTDAGLEALKPLTHLHEVQAAGTQITEAGKNSLKGVVHDGDDWAFTGKFGVLSLEVD